MPSSFQPFFKKRKFNQKDGTVSVSVRSAEQNLARKVAAIARAVKSYSPEVKYFSAANAGVNVATATGQVVHLSAIANGNTETDRIGDNIRLVSLEFNFNSSWANSINVAVNESPAWRFYIVQDLQQVLSTSPSVSDLITVPGDPQLHLRNSLQEKRFRVLFDSRPQQPVLGSAAGLGVISFTLPYKDFINVKRKVNIPIQYGGPLSSNIQKNGIYLFVTSNMVDVGAAACFDYTYSVKLGFTDV